MPKVEIKRKSRLTRQEVSERLIALGKALADGSEIELSSGGDSIELAVGDSIEWEIEIEIDGDETELEIELKWKDNPESATVESGAVAGGAAAADSDAPSDSDSADDSADDSDDDSDSTALEVIAIEELEVAAELEEDAETKLEIAAELEQEAAAELLMAAALEDDADVELETAELLEVESLVADDNPAAEGGAAAGSGPAR